MQTNRIRLRASVVLIDDGKILLVPEFEQGADQTKWVLPGGLVEFGEALERAAVRECQEETGLQITCEDIFDIHEVIQPDLSYHSVTIVFRGRIVSGEIVPELHPVYGRKEACWFEVKHELPSLRYHPVSIIEKAVRELV